MTLVAMTVEWLSEADAAAELGIRQGTLRNWRSRHYGPPYVKLGQRVQYRRTDLDVWREGQIRDPETSRPLQAQDRPRRTRRNGVTPDRLSEVVHLVETEGVTGAMEKTGKSRSYIYKLLDRAEQIDRRQ